MMDLPQFEATQKLSKKNLSNHSPYSQKRTLPYMYAPKLGNSPTQVIQEEAKPFVLNGISGVITYNLADILRQVIVKLKNSELFVFKSVWGHDPVNFYFPKELDWAALFKEQTFLDAFQSAFGERFSAQNLDCIRMAGFKINIETSGLGEERAYLTFETAQAFRRMFCLIMGTVLNAKLPCCACFPQNFLQWTAWQSGIKMNCISQDCSSWLESHSETYDSLMVGDCSQALTQLALVNIGNITANQSVTDIKLKISTTLNTIEDLLAPPSKRSRTN